MHTNKNPMPGALALGLLAATAACGDVVTRDYQGEPIATITGELTAPDTESLPQEVHLALAWYPGWLSPSGDSYPPAAIVTRELSYRGTFPQRYEFDLFGPPPDTALAQAPGAEGFLALSSLGLLLAYEDLNGNGHLDTLNADGSGGGDRVLGVSFGLDPQATTWPPLKGYMLYYVETDPANDAALAAMGFQRGFNLLGVQQVVPLSTPVPIELTGDPSLALRICNAREVVEGPPRTRCGIEIPRIGPDPEPQETHFLFVSGRISVLDEVGSAELRVVTEQTDVVSDATVSVDTTPVPWDDARQLYAVVDPGLHPRGNVQVRAQCPERWGICSTTKTRTMPAAPAVRWPTAGMEVKAGTTIQVQWSGAENAWSYRVEVVAGDGTPSVSRVVPADKRALWLTLDPAWSGDVKLLVWGEDEDGGTPQARTLRRAARSVPLVITP